MTAARKPRNEGPASGPFRIGEHGDQVSVGRKPDGRIWLNASPGTGVTVNLTEVEARQLHAALGLLLAVSE